MNNQFSQRVSDIIVYSKEEANRLRSRYIGPEHLLLGILRDGEGKAIEILSKLNTNLAAIKQQIEAQLKAEADEMLLPDAEVPLSNDAAKILKMCILEARGMKSNIADTMRMTKKCLLLVPAEVARMNANRHKPLPRSRLMIRRYLTISVLT